MNQPSIHRLLIDRILSKLNGQTQQNGIKLKALSSFANNVYKVQVSGQESQLNNQTFLLKIFRDYLDQFSNKCVQNDVVQVLAKNGQYSQIYFADPKYRLQGFIVGKSPTTENVTEQQMIKLIHRLTDLVKIFKEYVQKKPQSYQNIRRIQPMFKKFQGVSQQCKKNHPQSYQICKQFIEPILDKKTRQKLSKMVPDQMVFTHNDCHFHNVLITNSNELFLLDYQFSSPNYRGFQLGNFFNQFATDYITFQIKAELQLPQKTKDLLIKQYYGSIAPNISEAEAHRQVDVGRMLSHLFWLFIGVKQVKDPKITIDMQYYIRRRHQQFIKLFQKIKAATDKFSGK